ncbi:MAG: cyclic pyranopterin monophosphate synthase MoaC, partial [Leptospiraceae bacterium]|nr:cyclic pyranopterin monophosphate synthase MoaC [Leptospiraceae bacterium]
MKDITSKRISLRTAKACAYLFFDRKILDTIKNNEVPKGNIFEIAKTAGMLAAKKTPELIPHCHTISIDSLDIQFQTLEKENVENFLSTTYDSGIYIEVQAKSIGRTGLEMEALTCASTTALVLYDLLKPVTKDMEIGF